MDNTGPTDQQGTPMGKNKLGTVEWDGGVPFSWADMNRPLLNAANKQPLP